MGGGGMGSSQWTPSGIADNWRSHPWQQLFSTGLGMLVPGAGTVAGMGFRAYNNNRFNNAAANSSALGAAQGDQAAQAGFDRPLNGPHALTAGLPGAYGADDFNGVSGSGGGFNGGGLLDYMGPSMSGQQWMDRTGGYGNLVGQTFNVAPDRGPLVDSLLDPISMGPGLPGSGAMGPSGRRDSGFGDFRNSAGYGISPMQANGQNLIVGENGFDPNGGYVYNRRGVGY